MESDNIDLIDALAYDCDKLTTNLFNAESEVEKIQLIKEYIAKRDTTNRIPEFEPDLDWFNVTEPLSCSDSLKGKIVILDFFTYCCINCMHILPDLKKLEELFSVEDGLVVVGVHSAKFENEKDSSNILSAIQRYNITHPIVNDVNSKMWMNLKIQCWPTLLILGPFGNPLFVLMGEGHGEILPKYVSTAISYYKEKGKITSTSLPLQPSTDLIVKSSLKFPAKITCFKQPRSDDIFAVSDSGNNRILVINGKGDILYTIGGPESGFIDGNLKTARFNSPQGVAFSNASTIFVADTENNAIRKINLSNQTVETVAGTGKQGNDRIGGKTGKEQEISSPWDIAVYKTRDMDMSFHIDEENVQEKDVVLIAMAGTHQLWALFLEETVWWKFKKYPAMACASIIGNGMEENRNNSYPQNAAFAQPSGLAIAKKLLFIADSESSSIRKATLIDGKVMPIVGGDRNPVNLFAYGDTDGKLFSAKLQHPLGVCYDNVGDRLFVADTYNHKIKTIDYTNCTIETCVINQSNGENFQFNEPGGLCTDSSGMYLYVADTNNHNIQVVDLQTFTSKALELKLASSVNNEFKSETVLRTKPCIVKSEGRNELLLKFYITVEQGLKFTKGAPQKWFLDANSCKNWIGDFNKQNFAANNCIDIKLRSAKTVEKLINNEIIRVYCKVNACNSTACFPKNFSIEIPVQYDTNGSDSIEEDFFIEIAEKTIDLI